MNKIKLSTIYWIFFYSLVFFVLVNQSQKGLDPDFGWHLKTGEQIWQEKSVPHEELFNYPLSGQKWVDHEWLADLLIYGIYNWLGYPALTIIFALVIVASLAILHFLTHRYLHWKNNFWQIAIFSALSALGIFGGLPLFGVRVQEITILFCAILLLIFYYYQKNKKTKTLLWLIPLFYLWANLHAGFLAGLLILTIWFLANLGEIILSKIKCFDFKNQPDILPLKKLPPILLIVLATFGITFFTPYGIKLFQFLSDYQNRFYLTHLKEWLPFNYLPIIHWQIIYFSVAIICILFSLLIYITRNNFTKIPLWEVATAIIFLALSFQSKRHFPLLWVISLPWIGFFIYSFFHHSSKPKKKSKSSPSVVPLKALLLLVILLANLLWYFRLNIVTDPFTYFNKSYPYDAVQFLKNNLEYGDLRIFNDYGWGGYLDWVWPGKKIFIDGRLPQYPYQGRSFLEEYYDFFSKEKLADKLNEHEIELVLLPAKPDYYKLNWVEKYVLRLSEEKINQQTDILLEYLKNSAAWQNVYQDDVSVVFALNKAIPD
ncbi:MAG: hypothetical protein ACD_68C00001G0002 [uncultured bacterium]|nr:MAG: hypothetical protein ACD_68C00001G0002 [uncultured bacterium]